MSASGLPFDDLRALIASMPAASSACEAMVRERESLLVKPPGSLGVLDDIAPWLAAWQGQSKPAITRPLVTIFAANHGVYAQGVSAQPQGLTRQMLETFAAGGAAINQICATHDLGLKVFDLALDMPTADMTREAALDEKSAAATFAFGMEAIAGGADLLCLGETGIGGTTAAAAIFTALYGGPAGQWTGPEAGADQTCHARKIDAVERAIALHSGHLSEPLEVMRRLGGREICAIAGAIVAARMERVPVILDGYCAAAAAAILHTMNPSALDHCLAGHVSAETGHGEALRRIGKKPLLDLGITLGEGAGAALAAGLVKAALACHNEMVTREQAGVMFGGQGTPVVSPHLP